MTLNYTNLNDILIKINEIAHKMYLHGNLGQFPAGVSFCDTVWQLLIIVDLPSVLLQTCQWMKVDLMATERLVTGVSDNSVEPRIYEMIARFSKFNM